jgi:hypothetical protein
MIFAFYFFKIIPVLFFSRGQNQKKTYKQLWLSSTWGGGGKDTERVLENQTGGSNLKRNV